MRAEIAALTEQRKSESEESSKVAQDLRSTNSNLELELSEKENEIREAAAEKQRLVEEIDLLKSSFEQTESLLRVKEEENLSFVSRIEAESLQRSENTKMADLTSDNKHLQSELKKRQSLVSELVSDCMRLKQEVAKERTEKESSAAELVALRSQTQSLFALKAQYETNENHLKSELAEKDRVIHKQQEEVNATRSEHQLLLQHFGVKSLSELQELVSSYTDKIKALKSEVFEIKAEFEDLQSSEEALLQEKKDFAHTILDIKSELDQTHKKLAEKEKEAVELLHKCATLEDRDFVLEEELEDSRKQWEREKTRFLLEQDESFDRSKELERVCESSEQQVGFLRAQIEGLQQEARKSEAKVNGLMEQIEKLQAELGRLAPLNEQITKLENEFRKEDSVFKQLLGAPHPPMVMETYQQSSVGDTKRSEAELGFIHEQLQKLDMVLRRNIERNITESQIEYLEGQLRMSNVKVNEQAGQVSSYTEVTCQSFV